MESDPVTSPHFFLRGLIILVILAGTLARATGMSINRLLGRKYDVINAQSFHKIWSFLANKTPE